MYTTDNIFPVIRIKHLVNHHSEPTMPHQLANGMKPSVSNPSVLLCQCVVQRSTAHADKKALNMINKSQKYFCGIFVGIQQHQKWYLIYVPST